MSSTEACHAMLRADLTVAQWLAALLEASFISIRFDKIHQNNVELCSDLTLAQWMADAKVSRPLL